MAISLIDRIKQKNNGTFKLVESQDIDWGDLSTGAWLPLGSKTQFGMYKVGTGIDVADGVISTTPLNFENIKDAIGYTPADDSLVEKLANKNKANGYVGLDANSHITLSQIPDNQVNAGTLNGHASDYFAVAADTTKSLNDLDKKITDSINGLIWKPTAADKAALKALKAPAEGWTVSLVDSNKIYRFDAANTATADSADEQILVADDKTAGAWVQLGTTIYAVATQTADGLMSAADKKILDTLNGTTVPGLRTDITTIQGYFTDGKANTAVNAEKLGGKAPDQYALKADSDGKYAVKPSEIAFDDQDWTAADADGYTSKQIALTAGQKIIDVVRIDADKQYSALVDVELAADGTSATLYSSDAFAGKLVVIS